MAKFYLRSEQVVKQRSLEGRCVVPSLVAQGAYQLTSLVKSHLLFQLS